MQHFTYILERLAMSSGINIQIENRGKQGEKAESLQTMRAAVKALFSSWDLKVWLEHLETHLPSIFVDLSLQTKIHEYCSPLSLFS